MHVGLYGRDFLGQTYSLKQLILIWFQTVCLDEMWSERAIPSFPRDLQIGREKKIWMQTESIAKRAITKPIITGVWRRKQFHFFSFLFFSTIYDNSLSVYGILTRYRQFHVCPGRGKRKSKVTKLFLRSFPSDAHWKRQNKLPDHIYERPMDYFEKTIWEEESGLEDDPKILISVSILSIFHLLYIPPGLCCRGCLCRWGLSSPSKKLSFTNFLPSLVPRQTASVDGKQTFTARDSPSTQLSIPFGLHMFLIYFLLLSVISALSWQHMTERVKWRRRCCVLADCDMSCDLH